MQKPSVTLDNAVIFGELQELKKTVEELKRILEGLKERVVRTEADLSVIESGYHVVYNVLEVSGLMSAGEPEQKSQKEPVAVREETFTCLKFEDQQGAKLGQFSVAFKESNLVDKWTSAFNILRQSNSTIKDRYHGQDYQFSYWLYGEGKIYRQKLKPKVEGKT
jgi:hypothetical protein